MRRPSEKVLKGLRVLRPAISILIETPGDSELQECTEKEIGQAEAALAWIDDLLDDRKRPRAMRG